MNISFTPTSYFNISSTFRSIISWASVYNQNILGCISLSTFMLFSEEILLLFFFLVLEMENKFSS